MGYLRNCVQVYFTYLHIYIFVLVCVYICVLMQTKASKQAAFSRQQRAYNNHFKFDTLSVSFSLLHLCPPSPYSKEMTLLYPTKKIETSQQNVPHHSIPTSPITSIFIFMVIPLVQGLHTICPRLSHLLVPYTLLPSQEPHYNIFFLSLSSMALFYRHQMHVQSFKTILKRQEANFSSALSNPLASNFFYPLPLQLYFLKQSFIFFVFIFKIFHCATHAI